MLDARRMEVYAEVFDRALKVVRPIQADIVDADTYKEYLDKGAVYFFGMCREVYGDHQSSECTSRERHRTACQEYGAAR